jgi:hypothetical protein
MPRSTATLIVRGLAVGLVVPLVLMLVGVASAQAPKMPAGPDIYKLELKSMPEIKNGKIAIVEGLVDTAGRKLAVSDLSVMQPVQVTLLAVQKADDLRLELSKFVLGNDPAKSGSTKGNAYCSFPFRTQGDLQIKITSPEGPRLFRLMVWAGDEVMPPVPAPFISMETYAKRQAGGTAPTAGGAPVGGAIPSSDSSRASPVLWVIAGALVVIGALLGVLVLKRGKS